METSHPLQTAWRQQQRRGNQGWQQSSVVLQRVHELAQRGSRELAGNKAAKEMDAERLRLEMDLSKCIQNLEGKQGGARWRTYSPSPPANSSRVVEL